jgi:cytochrome b involved in lipid metabolism
MTSSNLRDFTLEELRLKDGKDGRDLYVLIDGKVYDITKYKHPGGNDVFEQGDDYQDLFEKFLEVGHSSTADRLMKKFLIGELKNI